MEFGNACNHPEENYLFSMEIEGEQCDVWVVEDACKLKCNRDHHEFCLRFGTEDWAYRSSWCCEWIEKALAHHTKFAYDNVESRRNRDQLLEFKRKLMSVGYWDLPWDLTPEVTALYPEDIGKDGWRLERLT